MSVNFLCLINKTINYSSKSSLLTLNTGYQLSTEENTESILRLFDFFVCFLFSSLPPRFSMVPYLDVKRRINLGRPNMYQR
jgi:hypothetical protein